MTDKQKYQNSRCYFDRKTNEILSYRPTGALTKNIVCFQSKLEARTFQAIARQFDSLWIHLQHPISLKRQTEYSGAIKYCCDFAIVEPVGLSNRNREKCLYIEAKGVLTAEASMKMKMLEIVRPDIRERLIIVSAKPQFYFGKKYPASTSLEQLESKLIEFKNDQS